MTKREFTPMLYTFCALALIITAASCVEFGKSGFILWFGLSLAAIYKAVKGWDKLEKESK